MLRLYQMAFQDYHLMMTEIVSFHGSRNEAVLRL